MNRFFNNANAYIPILENHNIIDIIETKIIISAE